MSISTQATMKTTLSLASTALLLAACSAPAPNPETFQEWAAGLDPGVEFTPYHMTFAMDMSLDMNAMMAAMPEFEELASEGGEEVAMNILYSVSGEMDMQSIDVGRMWMDLEMDLSAMEDADFEEPLEIGLLMISDGTTSYMQPEWKSEWLAEQLEDGGQNFAQMVFTVKNSALLRFIEVIGEVFDAENPGMFGDLEFMEAMRQNMTPTAWVGNLELFCVINHFEVIEDEVLIRFGISQDYWDALASEPELVPMFEMFEDLEYMLVADLRSGMPKEMSYTMSGPLQMSVAATFEPRAADSWEAGTFEYSLPEGRHLFPVDQFLELARTMMSQAVGSPDEDDFEF